MGYNGWTNHETWCVALWIGNDEGMYYTARDMATDAAGNIQGDEEYTADNARYDLADQLKEWIEEVAEMTCPGCIEGASFVSDLLGSALAAVDWDEIAQHQLDDALEGVQA